MKRVFFERLDPEHQIILDDKEIINVLSDDDGMIRYQQVKPEVVDFGGEILYKRNSEVDENNPASIYLERTPSMQYLKGIVQGMFLNISNFEQDKLLNNWKEIEIENFTSQEINKALNETGFKV